MSDDEFEVDIPSMDDLPPELAKLVVEVGETLQDIVMHTTLDIDELRDEGDNAKGAAFMAASMASRCAHLLNLQCKVVNGALSNWDDPLSRSMGVACAASIADTCIGIINGAHSAVAGAADEEE